METRNVTQYHVYLLVLNTFGRAEEMGIAAVSTDYDHLVSWYHDQFAESKWRDASGFIHTFKEGSPIENYNPCSSIVLNQLGCFGDGIKDEWVDQSSFETIPGRFYFLG